MIAHSLPSLLLTGHAARAATEHLRGVRQSRRDVDGTYDWALHLNVLTRAGRLQRAADLMLERLHDLDEPSTPHQAMIFAATCAAVASRLVDAGRGEEVLVPRRPSRLVPGPVSAAELVGPMREHALALAARFDARNGTDVVGGRVAALLDPSPLPDLPLDFLPETGRPARTGRRAAAVPEGVADSAGGVQEPPAADAPDDTATLQELAAALEAARTSGVRDARRRVLQVWEQRRESLIAAAPNDLSAARLDAALAVDQAETDPGVLAATVDLPARLRACGDPAAAVRFEFWQVNEAVQRRVVAPEDGLATAEALLARAEAELGPAGHAVACFLFLAAGQTIATTDGRDEIADSLRERAVAVVAAGLATLDRVALADLDGFDRACYASLLRIRSQMTDDPAEERSSIRRGLDLLPAGVRRGERALLAMDLAALLDSDGDAPAALPVLAEAEADAVAAGDHALAARAAGSIAMLLMRLVPDDDEAEDDPAGVRDESAAAVAAAVRAVRHAEATGEPVQLDQARRSLVHALRGARRGYEAAETAEVATWESSRRLTEAGLSPAEDLQAWSADGEGPARLDVHLAGALAWAAAVCAEDLDEEATAHAHALRSAGWHVRNGNPGAAAEALEIAARTADDAATAAGLWTATATAHRRQGNPWGVASAMRARVGAAAGAGGTEAGLVAAAEAHEAIDEAAASLPDDADAAARAEWEHCVVAERTATILARGDELDDALAMTEGLGARYRRLGDLGSVWDVAVLRCRILDAMDRFAEGEVELRAALAEAAEAAPGRARSLAELLADLLDDDGREDEARALRERFDLA